MASPEVGDATVCSIASQAGQRGVFRGACSARLPFSLSPLTVRFADSLSIDVLLVDA